MSLENNDFGLISYWCPLMRKHWTTGFCFFNEWFDQNFGSLVDFHRWIFEELLIVLNSLIEIEYHIDCSVIKYKGIILKIKKSHNKWKLSASRYNFQIQSNQRRSRIQPEKANIVSLADLNVKLVSLRFQQYFVINYE